MEDSFWTLISKKQRMQKIHPQILRKKKIASEALFPLNNAEQITINGRTRIIEKISIRKLQIRNNIDAVLFTSFIPLCICTKCTNYLFCSIDC